LSEPNPFEVDIRVQAPEPARIQEPVTCGIPFPRAALSDPACLALRDGEGNPVPLQVRVLDRWPDGSARWLLLDWQANVLGSARYRLLPEGGSPLPPAGGIRANVNAENAVIDTGTARFQVDAQGPFPFSAVTLSGLSAIDPGQTGFVVEDESGRSYRPHSRRMELEEAGPLRACLLLEGDLTAAGMEPLGEFTARLHFFAGSATVRFGLTLRNPRKADHPGGLWDLGNGGSVYVRDASFIVALPVGDGPATVRCSPEPGEVFETAEALELYQDSSGGANWKSSNHLSRHRVVPNSFCGYRLRLDSRERMGRRATPAVVLQRGPQTIALAMPYFWQNFPKAIEGSARRLVLRLFPRQYADVHEIQGGEQKTHTFSVAFGPDTVTEEPLAWCRAPSLARATPEWYCAAGVVPYLTPRAEDPHPEYLQLVDAAIEGEDTFEHKREVVDEYGWRHFGDIYGDHEAVFHTGPAPLVSHYNNQYDPIGGFACQFLRSGDARWWRQMDELAGHVIDIDIYHTDRDKSAYNHGLFWHTFHYVDADTGTHRSYPRRARVCGGGPGNEQNYTTGLMLHHFLTGDTASREAAIGLARWVIDREDGRKTVFRWLDRGPTGMASASRTPLYHGPGRGSANSVAALLDGYRLTGETAFLAKGEELIRRCIHPADDIPARNLLDAENRWFYTMFLQSLGRYLDYKAELGQLDFLYAYARASLLHYARWMAEHEYPYLDKPERLEYPTETWAAQDMRKSEVFQYAAMHAEGEERSRFLERSEFFFRYSVTTLSGMKTRSLARPVVLLLSHGWMYADLRKHPNVKAPLPPSIADFGQPEAFVPQKVRAKKRFLVLAALGALGLAGSILWLLFSRL
jgi:hypothetical protein